MNSAGKKLLTVLSIALLSQSTSFGIIAKASEKANLQNAKSKLDNGDYKQALKLYDELLQRGLPHLKFTMAKADHCKNLETMNSHWRAIQSSSK